MFLHLHKNRLKKRQKAFSPLISRKKKSRKDTNHPPGFIIPMISVRLQLPHKGDKGVFFLLIQLEVGYDIKKFHRVFQGHKSAVVHIRR